jgi:addiction module RelE/StbE family toxin
MTDRPPAPDPPPVTTTEPATGPSAGGERAVRWTRTAQRDLDAIVGYIAEDSLDNAFAVLERLQRRAETLTHNAERGRVVPELRAADVYQYRELIERPWRVVYRIEVEVVLVMAVLDGRRDLRSVLLERLVRV